jgi:hypothetical protein
MPAWLKAYDPTGERDRQWREMVAQRLNGSGAILIDGRGGPVIEDRNFADPLHLHWSSVPEFSEWVFRQIATRSKFASGREMNGAL